MHLLYRSKEGRGSGSTFPIGFPPFRCEKKGGGEGRKIFTALSDPPPPPRLDMGEEGRKKGKLGTVVFLPGPIDLRRHEATKVGGEIGVFGRSVEGGGGGFN